ncbi:MAG: hypothetical protein MI975_09900 [Cytophagales bacterium]|nr:hypothetical protein [Cytophagales bacterium]
MNELNLRIAGFLKVLSMLTVIGSLIYMYGYVHDDRMEFLKNSQGWLNETPKSYLFYFALFVFAIFNLLLNIGLSMYKNSEGYSKESLLFYSQPKKEKLIVWFTHFIAGVNLLITCGVMYVALIRINGLSDSTDYVYIPVFGALCLLGIITATLITVFKN